MKMYDLGGDFGSGAVVIANNMTEAIQLFRKNFDELIPSQATDEDLAKEINEREIEVGACVMFHGDI